MDSSSLIAVLGLLFAVPAAVLAILQIADWRSKRRDEKATQSLRPLDIAQRDRNPVTLPGNRNADIPQGDRNADIPQGDRNTDIPHGKIDRTLRITQGGDELRATQGGEEVSVNMIT